MPIYYSRSNNGFYDTSIESYILPVDAIEITADVHRKLLNASRAGARIVADKTGFPVTANSTVIEATNRLQSGIQINGRGFPNGKYACDDAAVVDIVMHIAYIGAMNTFMTGHTLDVVLYDNKTVATFTTPETYLRVMQQLLLYVSKCKQCARGIITDLPGDTIEIR